MDVIDSSDSDDEFEFDLAESKIVRKGMSFMGTMERDFEEQDSESVNIST